MLHDNPKRNVFRWVIGLIGIIFYYGEFVIRWIPAKDDAEDYYVSRFIYWLDYKIFGPDHFQRITPFKDLD